MNFLLCAAQSDCRKPDPKQHFLLVEQKRFARGARPSRYVVSDLKVRVCWIRVAWTIPKPYEVGNFFDSLWLWQVNCFYFFLENKTYKKRAFQMECPSNILKAIATPLERRQLHRPHRKRCLLLHRPHRLLHRLLLLPLLLLPLF